MKTTSLFTILFLMAFIVNINAQKDCKYFPTGMQWKEYVAEPSYPMDTLQGVRLYEIGGDTLINDQLYRKVRMNGGEISLWIRENGEKVFLLANDTPREILLYDFNWDGEELPSTEYLKEQEGNMVVMVQKAAPKYETTYANGSTLQYYYERQGVVNICGIGRVNELTRNSCLLGYWEPEMIPPTWAFLKVLWIHRNGKEVFRSESATEWINWIPSAINPLPFINNSCNAGTYDLSGRPVPSPPQHGLFIKDGKKLVQ